MNKLIEFNVPGGTVLVESQEEATGKVTRGASAAQVVENVGKSLGDVLSVIGPVADAMTAACDKLAVVPEHVEVEFGLKLTIGLGALIAASSTEGNLRVKLAWKPK